MTHTNTSKDPTDAREPVRLALIGAGIYARDAHIPSLLNLGDRFDLVAVYSRTPEAAAARAEQWATARGKQPETYTDLAALLARDDIEAVDILLPITLMPDVIEQALAAGKHVMSEKPIAPTVARGRRLLDHYAAYPAQTWVVAENWRYESAFRLAADLVQRGEIGAPLTCHYALHLPITPQSKYWETPWRRNWDTPGGWLLDGGVHHVAALRTVVGDVVSVQAAATLNRAELAPLDTLSATWQFANGAVGAYVVSYAVGAFWPPHLHVTGTRGSLRVERGVVEMATDGDVRCMECPRLDGVENELAAFADTIRTGAPNWNEPAEALRDVSVVESMLHSAETGALVRLD